MSDDEIDKREVQDILDKVKEEEERKGKNGRVSGTVSKKPTKDDIDGSNKPSKKNTVVNKHMHSEDPNNNSSNSDQDSSPHNSEEEKNNEDTKKDNNRIVDNDSSLENLMSSHNLNIRLLTTMSCVFCIVTTLLSIIGSLLLQRLLTFNGENEQEDDVFKYISMNKIMIYLLMGIIACFNFGLLILISSNSDQRLTQLIFNEINWFFVLTQFSFGSLFLITLLWKTNLWTINVCLSISMLTILFLAFYFTEIKQKKNMSKCTLIFIYIYISVIFSFIFYVTIYNIACILMENMEVQDNETKNVISFIIRIGMNAGQTILSFVLLTYFKDIFFASTSGYIIVSFIVEYLLNYNNFNEIIPEFIMAISIIIGIALTICRYSYETIGKQKENEQIGIIKEQ